MTNKLLQIIAQKKQHIVQLFYVLYGSIVGFAGYVVYGYFKGQTAVFADSIGGIVGITALSLLSIVLLPGIFRRFGIKTFVTDIIMIFRRQLGITTFLVAFTHYLFVKILPVLDSGVLAYTIFELFGLVTLAILTVMFFTSNDAAVKKLGVWWGRIHKLVYIGIWTLVLHILLQGEFGIPALIAVSIACLEVISLLYAFLQKRKKPATVS